MLREAILDVIYEWQKLIMSRGGVKRALESRVLASVGTKPIKIITGFRRSGKSFLLQRVANFLVQNKQVKLDNLLYLNFEDYRLLAVNDAESLGEAFNVFLQDVAVDGPKLIILDEIQNVENWDKFVRTLYEKSNNLDIYLTGSNSELLASLIPRTFLENSITEH